MFDHCLTCEARTDGETFCSAQCAAQAQYCNCCEANPVTDDNPAGYCTECLAEVEAEFLAAPVLRVVR